MHILLTDILTCPRCGPELGLILLADRVEDRRVLAGRLGCANCRETYPIAEGAVDLRTATTGGSTEVRSPQSAVRSGEDPAEEAVRLAALLGLADVHGTVLIAGPGAALAGAVSTLVPEVEAVALTAAPPADDGAPGVSRMAGGPALPFRDRSLRGVALTGGADDALLSEGVRVLSPGSRLVVHPAPPGTAGRLAAGGAGVILDQDGVVVARAPGAPVQLRLNALR
ncbi:MAG TPA: Trm112 family protein [Longimicrobiaceae bacterium]|nr:Trm112 family protein [Longimicrobiaceae bacterium]